MKIKIKRIYENATLPKQMSGGAAGLDLVATSMEFIRADDGTLQQIKYGTGLALEIPEGYFGCFRPRSSIVHTGLRLANSVGTIDSDYRGELTAVFDVVDPEKIFYKAGERIAQLLILEHERISLVEVSELGTTARGIGGYGSTGK
jgi:dUTP pyrophosphatase